MRLVSTLLCCGLIAAFPVQAASAAKGGASASSSTSSATPDGPIDVTADKSLEWYQEQRLYVARGNAKAIRGSMTVEADLLTAHEREKASAPAAPAPKSGTGGATSTTPSGGSIDRLTADGHVHITDPRQQVFGDHAVYDLDRKIIQVTGNGLKYVTEKDLVTARDSLEYYDDKDMAVARGDAVAIHDNRHVEGDVLTAYFAQGDTGAKEMTQMTADGNVTIVTATDVSRGDHAVYDAKSNAAILTGHVRITRDGTQLTGDRAEADFDKGESRLLNEGSGRVRALLTPEPSKDKGDKKAKSSQKADAQ